MDDRAVACWCQIDYLAHRGGIFVACNNESPRLDLAWVAGLVEECPDVASVVFVVKVGANVHVARMWHGDLARDGSVTGCFEGAWV